MMALRRRFVWTFAVFCGAGAAGAAALLLEGKIPYAIAAVTPEMPQGMQGLEPVADPMMLKYRSASREFLFKADIAK